MPVRGRLPFIDSGVFLYVGWRVTQGELPYRDAWDSKPPLVYYLDAAGLEAGGGSEWGVWALQWLFLLGAILLSLELLEGELGLLPAALATALWVISLSEVLEMGNMTEQYGLTLKFATLVLLARRGGRGRDALLGAATGALFLLKENLVGLSAAWAVLALFEEPARLLPAAAGFAAVLAAPAAYFAAKGALGELWRATVVYNAVNESPGFGSRWGSFLAGAQVCWESFLPALAGAALLTAAPARRKSPLLKTCLLALPLELAAACATGRAYRHYYAAWLPVFAVLAAAAFARAARSRPGRRAAAAAAALLAVKPGLIWARQVRDTEALRPDPVALAIDSETRPGDTALVWGDGARYLFAARRAAPSRFCIAHPLLRRGFSGPALSAEFLASLRKRPPALLVDLSRQDADIPPLESALRPQWPPNGYYEVPPSLEAPLAWLESRYAPERAVGRAIVWRPWGP
jgi:hypothetical protein